MSGEWKSETGNVECGVSKVRNVNVLCSLFGTMLSKSGFFSKKARGRWPAAVKTCWQALISFIFVPRRLQSSTARIFSCFFYLPAQSSKLLYMQDRIPFSPTLNKLLNNKIEYFCFVVCRVRCLLPPSNLVLVQRRKWQANGERRWKQSGKEKQIHRDPARGKSMGMITSRIIIIMSVVCCLLMKWRLRIVWRASSA